MVSAPDDRQTRREALPQNDVTHEEEERGIGDLDVGLDANNEGEPSPCNDMI